MAEALTPEFYKEALSLVGTKTLCVLLDKSRLTALPQHAKNITLRATTEQVRYLGLEVDRQKKEVYAFTSEYRFAQGVLALKKDPRFEKREIMNIVVTPSQLFAQLSEKPADKVFFDYASTAAVLVEGPEELGQYTKVALLAKIASLRDIHVVTNEHGYALSVEMEGKNYALAYFEEQDAKSTMDGLAVTNPGARLDSNTVRDIALGVLHSDFDGLVINPAMASQAQLPKEDLEALILVDRILFPPLFSWDGIKKRLSR